MEKVLNEIYRQYLSLLRKTKEVGLDETSYFLELTGQVFEKEAHQLLSQKRPFEIKKRPSEDDPFFRQ